MADDQTNTRDSTDSALRRLAHAPPVDPDAFLHGTRAARLTPGTVIDEMFVVRERLGHGGMGVVYRAWHEALDRDVAIKLCRRQVNARETARLLKEAQATAAFSDPNIVVVHHVGTMEDQVYLVMEYVGGGTLGEWARAEPRPWRKIVGQLAAAARGLAAAHDHGLVHRDFKPENVLVGEDGRVRVSDFGLAVPFGASSADASVPGPAGDDATASATPTGPSSQQHAGTPRYMAPEQYSGDAVTPATDQFALCLVLYELLSGAHPFEGDRAAPGAKRRPSAIPRRVANRVRVAVERGLSVAPADRHASMHALVERLDTDVRWGPAAAMLGGGAAGLAAIVVASTPADDPCAAPLLEPPRWSDAARHSLRARFADSSLAAGKVLAARVERELDAYVEQWRSAERAICRDTDGEPERRRARHACLNVRKVEVASVRDLLAAGDAEALARALGTVARLPRPGACASDDLARLARAAPVEDVALGETLARANAALSVRRLDLA
ncbi:MAG: serine/threonine-protein kinase, partial [Myxococcota bacterium]